MTENKTVIPNEYIIKLQGKDFITHRGLLAIAHEKGLHSIETELITEATADIIVFKAIAIIGTGVHEKRFSGYGDASKSNVNSNIAPHMIRMAETRAINRALRLATNVGMCSAEEMGDIKKTTEQTISPQVTQKPPVVAKPETFVCIGCKALITEKVYKYSMDKYGMSLCFICQKKKERGDDYLPKAKEEVVQ